MNINNHSSRLRLKKNAETHNMERIHLLRKLSREARTMKEKFELMNKLKEGLTTPL
ncbi:MAG: hypothetical protein ACSHX0_00040 [Akkermansiaceae bacterium]